MTKRIVGGTVLTGAVILGLWAGFTRAGDDKSGWKKFLPADVYKELIKREATTVLGMRSQKLDAEAIKKGQAAAVMAAAYTWCAKEGDHGPARATALALALTVKKGDPVKIGESATALVDGKGDKSIATPPGEPKDFADLYDIMIMYKFKSKGGDGVHADLQLNKKLKTTQNSIEELIRTVARKAPEGEALDKASKELELLSYRVAASGALTWHYAPKDKAAEWQKYCVAMREGAIDLAEMARKKDGEGIVKAATRVNDSCNDCHAAFRK